MLETERFTQGLWSRDGTHFDMYNVAFAQLLLNLLDHLQRTGAIEPQPERDDGHARSSRVTTALGLHF